MMGTTSQLTAIDLPSIDQPLHVVLVCGEIVVFADDKEFFLSPAAAEETSRRLASIAAIARTQAVA